MTEDAKRLLEQAMTLAPKDRAELAARLVASVNAVSEAEAAWASLIRERARRVLSQELGTTTYLRNPPPNTVRFELDAEVDLERATTWYEGEGKMEPFLAEVRSSLEKVRANPGGYGFHGAIPKEMGVRRVHLAGFPYTMAFVRIRSTEIRVLAVAHNYRSPADGEISIGALIQVEEWLAESGWRALSALSGLALGATAVPLIAH
jgi:hypothetical protein